MTLLKTTILPAALALLLASSLSCGNAKRVDLSGIDTEFDWVRFDSVLQACPVESIPVQISSWRVQYGFLFDNPLPDSELAITAQQFVSDPGVREAFREVGKAYGNIDWLKKELETAFRHMIYYFPEFEVPRLYLYVSGLDYNYPVKYGDTAMAIGLDMYLGNKFPGYKSLGLPLYKQRWFVKECIARDCMEEVYLARFSKFRLGGSLLDYLVESGKKYCFIQGMMPDLADTTLLRYTEEQMIWCEKHESKIWSHIIEQQLLYSNDREKISRLIQDGPFTPGFADDSPGRLADFIGWKLVQSYTKKNPETSLIQLIEMQNSRALLDASGYKP